MTRLFLAAFAIGMLSLTSCSCMKAGKGSCDAETKDCCSKGAPAKKDCCH